MQTRYFLIVMAMAAGVAGASSASAEVVRMDDGTVYQGRILNQSRFVITIQLPDGRTKRLLRRDVAAVMSDEEWRSARHKQTRTKAVDTVVTDQNITDEERALIRRLIQVSGAQEALLSLYETLLQKASAQDRETIRRRFNVYDLVERLIPVYASVYDERELRELIQFYSSPLGQKMLQNSPFILEHSFQTTLTYLMSLLNHTDGSASQRSNAGQN